MLNVLSVNTAYDHYIEQLDYEPQDTKIARCRNLIKCVLLQAVWDLKYCRDRERQDIRYDAWLWFMSRETGLFLSFYNICQILEINHELIRDRLKARYGDLMRREACIDCGDTGCRYVMHHDPASGYYRCERCHRKTRR